MFGAPKEEEPSILGKLGFQQEKQSTSSRVMDQISQGVVPTFQEEPVRIVLYTIDSIHDSRQSLDLR
jgi:hypothetical protein